MDLKLKPIGHIETPYDTLEECPRNIDPDGPECRLILNKAVSFAIIGLDIGDRILILYWLGQADRSALQQNSRRTGELSGVFALRTPNRPNPVGAAVLTITDVGRHSITVRGLDCVNGTILLDIKPAMSGE